MIQPSQKMLNDVAQKLHGRQYRDETTKEIEEYCALNNIIILFGASDDLAEFRGAVDDEIGCFDGGEIAENPFIEAIFAPENKPEQTWVYKLPEDLINATFDIFRDDEVYCTGVVFFKPTDFKLKNED
jgi:hypothetical protein